MWIPTWERWAIALCAIVITQWGLFSELLMTRFIALVSGIVSTLSAFMIANGELAPWPHASNSICIVDWQANSPNGDRINLHLMPTFILLRRAIKIHSRLARNSSYLRLYDALRDTHSRYMNMDTLISRPNDLPVVSRKLCNTRKSGSLILCLKCALP
jgi:hypothetical protein